MTVIRPALCRLCRESGEMLLFPVREMYFGTREVFDYLECPHCGSLQIATIPDDMAPYYPPDYYSYGSGSPKPVSPTALTLRRRRTRAWLGRADAVGGPLARLSKKPEYLDWFAGLGLDTDSRILDVGCGGGQLLRKMARDGFTRLAGIDPFLGKERIVYPEGVEINRLSLDQESGIYDLVMMHHSLEHTLAPHASMAAINAHLSDNGRALIRVPVSGGYAWRKYRQHWFALDAPRHLFVPSVRGMHLLAQGAGLEVERIFFDSDAGQFLASEGYQLDMPLVEQMRSGQNFRSPAERAALTAEARRLNMVGDGDCAGFVLRRKNGS